MRSRSSHIKGLFWIYDTIVSRELPKQLHVWRCQTWQRTVDWNPFAVDSKRMLFVSASASAAVASLPNIKAHRRLILFPYSSVSTASFQEPQRIPGSNQKMRERESAGSWSFKPDGICSLNTIPLQSDTALILHFSSRLFCCCQHKPIPNKIPAYGYGGHKIHNEVQNGAGGPGPNPPAGRFWPTGSMFDTPNLTPSHCTSENDVKACRTGNLPHQFSDLQAADCHLKHWCAPCCTRWWRMTAELTVHAHHYTL